MIARIVSLCLFALVAALGAPRAADPPFITLVSTTTTNNSGLMGHILPLFERASGTRVRVVVLGTGQALRVARNGDADVVLVHHTPSEEAFVAEGYGVSRRDVMFNDFVIVGPRADPAGIRGLTDAALALATIAESGHPFASRGDRSGTHIKELDLWIAAACAVDTKSASWYRQTGSGMGATLNTALGMGAYTLVDRGTWLSFGRRGDFEILVEGDPRLRNQYGVILVDSKRHPHVKAALGQAFVDWILSPEGQSAIDGFRIGGRRLFIPNARRERL